MGTISALSSFANASAWGNVHSAKAEPSRGNKIRSNMDSPFSVTKCAAHLVTEKGESMFDRILLPLDGSALAECTFPHALALAKLDNAEIVPILVLDGSVSGEAVDPMEWHLRKSEAQNYIDTVCSKLE